MRKHLVLVTRLQKSCWATSLTNPCPNSVHHLPIGSSYFGLIPSSSFLPSFSILIWSETFPKKHIGWNFFLRIRKTGEGLLPAFHLYEGFFLFFFYLYEGTTESPKENCSGVSPIAPQNRERKNWFSDEGNILGSHICIQNRIMWEFFTNEQKFPCPKNLRMGRGAND